MAKDEEKGAAAEKPDSGSELDEMLMLRAGMALLPIFFRRVTVVEKPRRHR